MGNLVNAFDKATWDDTEEAYFAYVDKVIAKGKDERFSNGKPWHAAYLIFKFLQRATQHVRLFSGTLVRTTPSGVRIYSERAILDAVGGFLKRPDSKLHIALEKEIDVPGHSPHEHPLIESVCRLKKEGQLRGTLEVRTVCPKAADLLRKRGILHHMMLMDDRGWRFEVEDDVKAIVNAGNGVETRALCQAFDIMIWKPGTTISIVQPEI